MAKRERASDAVTLDRTSRFVSREHSIAHPFTHSFFLSVSRFRYTHPFIHISTVWLVLLQQVMVVSISSVVSSSMDAHYPMLSAQELWISLIKVFVLVTFQDNCASLTDVYQKYWAGKKHRNYLNIPCTKKSN